MPRPDRKPARSLFRALSVLVGATAVLLALAWVLLPSGWTTPALASLEGLPNEHPPSEAVACAECHRYEFEQWMQSHHAMANRPVDLEKDKPAFFGAPHAADATATLAAGRPVVRQDGQTFSVEAVIGVTPLIQFLVPKEGGRFQALNPGFDPARQEWFDIFEGEGRQPGDWGHWTGRGMNWNSQCAFCHMTDLQKNYDIAEDAYSTAWRAQGISCSQCHGPMTRHATNPEAPLVAAERISPERAMENCASCHSRREELTGTFQPGDAYHEHYRLALPDLSEVYYADGQVREENFVYAAFQMSRMAHKDVTCLDCHDPHTGSTIQTVDNNASCLSCHAPPGQREATLIPDPVAHSHHAEGSSGNLCVNCHMPETTYMARDPRRDHGFTLPDPVLTREAGIPNACNRCHAEESVDWAVQHFEAWYGKDTDRPTRKRALALAGARRADAAALPALLEALKIEEVAAWRASLMHGLGAFIDREEARAALRAGLEEDHVLIRSAALRALAPLPDQLSVFDGLVNDENRLIRLDAAWNVLAHGGKIDGVAREELQRFLDNQSDQPAGALRQMQLALMERRDNDVTFWGERMLEWEPSPGAQIAYAQALNTLGRREEALAVFDAACAYDPPNAEAFYLRGLLLAETDRLDDAMASLMRAVEINPSNGRAWYNLGLAYSQTGDLVRALDALDKAHQAMPESADAAYAAATIHLRRRDRFKAIESLQRGLQHAPGHQPSRELLRSMQGN